MGVDYRAEGVTMQRLGLAGMTSSEIGTYLHDGAPSHR